MGSMTKAEVRQLSEDAMIIPGGRVMRTPETENNKEVKADEVDDDDNRETESHSNNMNFCPNCGTKLRHDGTS